jgi:hypothetical protein
MLSAKSSSHCNAQVWDGIVYDVKGWWFLLRENLKGCMGRRDGGFGGRGRWEKWVE